MYSRCVKEHLKKDNKDNFMNDNTSDKHTSYNRMKFYFSNASIKQDALRNIVGSVRG